MCNIKHWKWNAGGASGIGLETARVLALRKVHVIIGARNMESAKEAKQVILHENESARVDILKLDLCSINSVRTFVDNFIALSLPLNILMCFLSLSLSLSMPLCFDSTFWYAIVVIWFQKQCRGHVLPFSENRRWHWDAVCNKSSWLISLFEYIYSINFYSDFFF